MDNEPTSKDGCLIPASDSFAAINAFSHHPDVSFEDLQSALLGLAARAEKMSNALVSLCVGGCTCMTKTPILKFHDPRCRYRLAAEALGDR